MNRFPYATYRTYCYLTVLTVPWLFILMLWLAIPPWYIVVLFPLLVLLLSVNLHERGLRGTQRILLVASLSIVSVALMLGIFFLTAIWSWWVFGMTACIAVGGVFWLERYLRARYPHFGSAQARGTYEHVEH